MVQGLCSVSSQKKAGSMMNFTIEIEQEDDGRFIAEVSDLPGVLAYGENRQEAIAKVQVLALRVLADRLEHGESTPEPMTISFVAA
jgi:predicted RNase H-like HicB family nuclease